MNMVYYNLLLLDRLKKTCLRFAGERRFRAIQSLNLPQADVIIRDMDDEETAVVALIENIQRENLSVVEEAEAYKNY